MTFLELLITVTIIMVFASVALPLTKATQTRVKEIELRQELRKMRAAIDEFKLHWNRNGSVVVGTLCATNKLSCKEVTGLTGYPKSLEVLTEIKLSGEQAVAHGLTTFRYLRKIPVDPMTRKADWILRCHSDPPNASSWCGDDVYDLASSSSGIALDGTRYRDW